LSSQARSDPKAYYRILGLEPGAGASAVRAAYRVRAMQLHPDRNPERDTTAEFQALQQAYRVLSAPRSREQYDADSVVNAARSEESAAGPAPSYSPIYCVRCQAVSAQPRYRVFYTVCAWFWGTSNTRTQGFFCGACEFKVGVRATATTLLAGWWSLPGLVSSGRAVGRNFVGRSFDRQSAEVMGLQAMYFAYAGKVDLALAVARQALTLLQRSAATTESRPMAQVLLDLIAAYPGRASATPHLKPLSMWSRRRVLAQAGLVSVWALSIALLVRSTIGVDWLEPATLTSTRASDVNSTVGVLHELRKRANEMGLRSGLGANEQAAVQGPELSLPVSGVYQVSEDYRVTPLRSSALKLVNPVGSHKLVTVLRATDQKELLSVFVRSGAQVEVDLPVGVYRAKVVAGQTWFGELARFGAGAQNFVVANAFECKLAGAAIERTELVLAPLDDPSRPSGVLVARDL